MSTHALLDDDARAAVLSNRCLLILA